MDLGDGRGSDELAMPGGRLSRFPGGEITWTPAGGLQVRLAVPFDDQ
jgi:hypothetical protein